MNLNLSKWVINNIELGLLMLNTNYHCLIRWWFMLHCTWMHSERSYVKYSQMVWLGILYKINYSETSQDQWRLKKYFFNSLRNVILLYVSLLSAPLSLREHFIMFKTAPL